MPELLVVLILLWISILLVRFVSHSVEIEP